MDIGTVGIVIIVASGIVSFALGRYFSNKRREKKDAQKRAADWPIKAVRCAARASARKNAGAARRSGCP